MREPTGEIHRLLRDNAVLGVLPDHERDGLASQARIERCKSPTLLNAAHAPLESLRLVIQGHIEVIARTSAGGEVALGALGPGTWATWVGCFVAQPPNHDFYSSSDARFLALTTQSVRAAAQRNPVLYPLVIAELGVRMRQLMEWAGDAVL
ncbi:MAG: cyclic nucleotide-binding domain-containing protein, partial [Burkholderiaceae bacterium]